MYAVEFETDITGNTIQIPNHLLKRVAAHKHVKIILLLPEEIDVIHKMNLKSEILEIGKNCSSLPLLDNRTANDILGYDNNGIAT